MTAKFSVRTLAALAICAGSRAAASVLPAARLGFTDVVTSHVVPMVSHDVSGTHDLHLRRRSTNVSTSLTNVHDVYYIIDLLVGNETIPVSIDTGSSDTWMVKSPYKCISFRFDNWNQVCLESRVSRLCQDTADLNRNPTAVSARASRASSPVALSLMCPLAGSTPMGPL